MSSEQASRNPVSQVEVETVDFQQPPHGPVTVGQALELAGDKKADKPLTTSDARAIQSAEDRATRGGPGSVSLSALSPAKVALSAVDSPAKAGVTLGEVLEDASKRLVQDKVVTPRDAATVHSAEARNARGQIEKGGVAATLQQAADHNEKLASAD